MRHPSFARLLIAAGTLPLGACSTVGYYAHLAHGEYSLLAARQPIERVVADPATDARLKARLELAEEARAFASDVLKLPRNRSYTKYADLHRPYATWNVFAAPEFSLDPVRHCFPFAGCVAYRGYYDRAHADAEAARLGKQGYETWIGGSAAYSTLGWFADPILNTMLRWGDDELIGTIFHELAHQQLYVKDDTEFNESFATFVQREGLRQWRAARGLPEADTAAEMQADEFGALVFAVRERLKALYASGIPADAMRARKQEEIDHLRAEYYRMRDERWGGKGDWDEWIAGDINNAKLLPFGLYHRWVVAFAALYKNQNGDWAAFHAAVAKIAKEKPVDRTAALQRLSE